ncbi:hypothetical protein [Candidatus Nanohalococcus occultus]|uniref:hypothetical protein n=1 Tax=Candidatus Nanohalococcus occultus TaxID=2978047 RepID=UPI0039E03828
MDRQTVILATTLTVLVGLTGLQAGIIQSDQNRSPEQANGFEPVTADSENNVATASFYNQSIDLMYEDRAAAKMYLDYDRDGSFDHQIDVESDGERHNTSRTVTLGEESYGLYFSYSDDAGRTDDGQLTLYKVTRP